MLPVLLTEDNSFGGAMSFSQYICLEKQTVGETSNWEFVSDQSSLITSNLNALAFLCDLMGGHVNRAFAPPFGERGFPDDASKTLQQHPAKSRALVAGWLTFFEYQHIDWDEALDAAVELTDSVYYDIVPTVSDKFREMFRHLDGVEQKRWFCEGILHYYGKTYQHQHFSRGQRITEGWQEIFHLLALQANLHQDGDARIIAWYTW
jgi:hypothetical protein